MLFGNTTLGIVLLAILLVVGVAVVFFVLPLVGRKLMRLLVGLVLNTVLGFVVMFVLGYFLSITFQYSLAEIIAVVLFGLPAVGTFLLLKAGGVVLAAVL